MSEFVATGVVVTSVVATSVVATSVVATSVVATSIVATSVSCIWVPFRIKKKKKILEFQDKFAPYPEEDEKLEVIEMEIKRIRKVTMQ